MPSIEVWGLCHEYPDDGGPLRVLDDVSFSIAEGESVALLGRSGAGKTTLLSILGGLEPPQTGTVKVGEHDLAALDGDRLAAYRRTTVGFVFQHFGLLDELTAAENVELAMTLSGRGRRARRRRAAELLDAVGLSERARHRPPALSGGERQRVAIARAMANDPALLLADEPTGNLDADSAGLVLDLLDSLRDGVRNLLVVTHDKAVAARADRSLVLDRAGSGGEPVVMGWRDAVAIAARGAVRRRSRAALTVLAVALAATLMTAALVIAETARTRVLDQLSKGGPLSGISVKAEVGEDQVAAVADLADVKAVLPVLTTEMRTIELGRDAAPLRELTVVGVDLRDPSRLPVTVVAGRLPLADSRVEIAVGQDYLEQVGLTEDDADSVLGTELEMGTARGVDPSGGGFGFGVADRWTRAVVVGVVAQEAARGELVAPLPAVLAAERWSHPSSAITYDGLFVVARGLDRIGDARRGLASLGLPSDAPENLIAAVQRYLHVLEIVLGGIGLIALTIASLGIANALLAAVRERRREIGVLKAIGARDRDVRRVFLVEAAMLGLAGGAVGTVLGSLVARAVGAVVNAYLTSYDLASVRIEMPLVVVAAGVLGSAALALVAGTVPAARAARLPAGQALGSDA